MKRYTLFILAMVSFLFSGCLRSLEKEGISPETIYKGRIIDSNSRPLNGIMVRVTNGNLIYNSVLTGQNGMFQITVDITKIDNTYYIQIGEEGSLVKRSSLKGFGQDVYDYGDIPFENINLPVVETIGLTDMTESSFTCKCNVKSKGGAIVKERGLCWSTNIPTVDDHKEVSGGGEGIYSCTVHNVSISMTIYYARAFARNEYGVSYGEPVEVNSSKMAYFSLPTIEFGGYTYHIHPDMGGMQWEQGRNACDDLVAYGFDDWFMPNKEEMLAISNLKNILDGKVKYWTSTSCGNSRYYYLTCSSDGEWYSSSNYDESYSGRVYHVVPVRKDR